MTAFYRVKSKRGEQGTSVTQAVPLAGSQQC